MSKDMTFIEALGALMDNADKIPELVANAEKILTLVKDADKIPEIVGKALALEEATKKVPEIAEKAEQTLELVRYNEKVLASVKEEQIAMLATSVAALDAKVDSLSSEIQEKSIPKLLEGITESITESKINIVKSFGDISKIQAELSAKEAEISSKSGEISNLQSQLTEKSDEIKKLKDELQDKADYNEKSAKLEAQDAELTAWKKASASYQALREAMKSCESASAFLDKRGISEEGTESVFKLAVAIGCTTDFAKAFHDFMKSRKLESKQPMSADEQKVYAAMNRCYRDACGTDRDVFQLPDGRSVTEIFDKLPFDKASMEDLTEPKNTTLKYAQELYVPSLKSLTSTSGGLLCRSQVKAGNS